MADKPRNLRQIHKMFNEVGQLVGLIIAVACSSAAAETSYSALRRLKTYLPNSVNQEDLISCTSTKIVLTLSFQCRDKARQKHLGSKFTLSPFPSSPPTVPRLQTEIPCSRCLAVLSFFWGGLISHLGAKPHRAPPWPRLWSSDDYQGVCWWF